MRPTESSWLGATHSAVSQSLKRRKIRGHGECVGCTLTNELGWFTCPGCPPLAPVVRSSGCCTSSNTTSTAGFLIMQWGLALHIAPSHCHTTVMHVQSDACPEPCQCTCLFGHLLCIVHLPQVSKQANEEVGEVLRLTACPLCWVRGVTQHA